MKKIILAVTNDLTFDQRMQKIGNSLAQHGFEVTLVGFRKKKSQALPQRNFHQIRLGLLFQKGFAFFAETNIRLFLYFLFSRADVMVANDLDTAMPVLFASAIRRKKRVFDAHELFCEMHDIVRNKPLYKFWKVIEKICQPRFKEGYTENESYAREYEKMYGVRYFVVMNSPPRTELLPSVHKNTNTLIYQGVVDRGRGFEGLIPALQQIDAHLIVCGKGTFFHEVQKMAAEYDVLKKIDFKGFVVPEKLKQITPLAHIGLNMNANLGASFYYSLSNRFFDYMHSCLPQVTMNYPENRKINDQFEVAVLIDDLSPETIKNAIDSLLYDKEKYTRLQENCLRAREIYNWENEEKKLVAFYQTL